MITLYFFKRREDNLYGPVSSMSESREYVEEKLNGLSYPQSYEICTIDASDKCKCENYDQTTMILLDMREPGVVKLVGSDNYYGIHKKLYLPIDVDIETHTNGKYQLVSMDYFNEHFSITTKVNGDVKNEN